MKRSILFSTLAALVIVAGLGTASGAAAKDKEITDLGGCDFNALEGATACEGIFSKTGQPDAEDFNGLNVFGINDWKQINKVDNETGDTDGVLTVTGIGGKSGTWSFTTGETQYDEYMAVLKGGLVFTAFLLEEDLDGSTPRTWASLGAVSEGKKPIDLSNFALYGSSTPSTVIPLPAAGWLLISVFGGLGVANHLRKRRAA